jgi:hypothetical protein
VTLGTNVLIGRDWGLLRKHFHEALNGARKKAGCIPLWDGNAAKRIAEILTRHAS